MATIYESLTDLIGKTPLLKLNRFSKEQGVETPIIAKLEYLNPAGSVKDRIAFAMIDTAEKSGVLKKGAVIIEPTSGNTGIGLASVAAAKGYRIILTMPETMSIERRNLLNSLPHVTIPHLQIKKPLTINRFIFPHLPVTLLTLFAFISGQN